MFAPPPCHSGPSSGLVAVHCSSGAHSEWLFASSSSPLQEPLTVRTQPPWRLRSRLFASTSFSLPQHGVLVLGSSSEKCFLCQSGPEVLLCLSPRTGFGIVWSPLLLHTWSTLVRFLQSADLSSPTHYVPNADFINCTDQGNLGAKVFFVWGSLCMGCFFWAYFLVYETKGWSTFTITN